jgi:outer membrane receptor for ferrienterochelin and colicin
MIRHGLPSSIEICVVAAIAFFVLLPALFHVPIASAQVSKVGATLEGTVSDTSGGAIANVTVTLQNTGTGQTRAALTDDRGSFHAPEIAAGAYEVIVERAGFAPYHRTGIDLAVGESVQLNIVLAPASSSAQLTVTAQAEGMDVSQTSVVSTIDGERIEELPVRSRNYLDFVLLAPGVLSSPATPPASGATMLAGSGFSAGGMRARSNNISIDGLDNNDEYTGSSRIELSPEIVQEFQVVNNGLSAESGGASGGSINVITRSGTNAIHGDAFIFVQDSALNARDPFESDPGKPAFRRYRAGAALGGPIVQGRTFYYAALEQESNRGESGSDIAAGAAAAINRLLASGADARLATRDINTGFFPIARAETEAAAKLNHQVTSSTSLMVRYAFTNNREASDAFNTGGLTDTSGRGSEFTSDSAVSGALTTVYGSQAVGDLRMQAAKSRSTLRTNDLAGPEIDIAGIADFGRPYGGVSERHEVQEQGLYTYTRTRGQHVWKVGGGVNHAGLNATVPDGFRAVYIFATLADFLAGRPDQFRQAFGGPNVNFGVTSYGGFAQDHWSVTPHITLDAGLRYDFDHLPSGLNLSTHNFSPRIGAAWSPSPKWVLRAGYGVFFDRYILANLARPLEKNGLQAFEQVADGNAAANLFAASGGGPLAMPASGIAPSIFRADPRLGTPYGQQASAGTEYQVAAHLTIRADYLFVRGMHLARTVNVNLLPPVILTAANAASLGVSNSAQQQIGREVFSAGRSNAQFDDIFQIEDSASSTYNGLALTVERRMFDELEFAASYTVSKAVDDASDFDEQPQNPYDPASERALSRQDQRHLLVLNALWELPIGDDEDSPKKSHTPANWPTRIFRHIELAPIVTVGSGRPVNPLTGVDSSQNHAFPLSARPLGLGRNSLRTPGIANADFRVLKYFPFGKSAHLDVVAEAFNLFNRANVSQINPIFGTSLTPLGSLGQPIAGLGARRVEFSLDYEF